MKTEDADKLQKMSKTNPKSIHFIPKTLPEKTRFTNLLTRELLLRELPALDDITLRRERLRDVLRRERGESYYQNSSRKENESMNLSWAWRRLSTPVAYTVGYMYAWNGSDFMLVEL
eukprot:scaffold8482_cov55-Attheya_sp.AAC.1